MKIRADNHGDVRVCVFYCPGCKYHHAFTIGQDGWTWNGDIDKPTFTPSLMVNGHDEKSRCHLFMNDGMIQFLADCHHDMKNTTVECPDYQ